MIVFISILEKACKKILQKKHLQGSIIALNKGHSPTHRPHGHHVSTQTRSHITLKRVRFLLNRSTPHGPRRASTSRLYANPKNNGVFLGIIEFTLDARAPVFTAAKECCGGAADLQGTTVSMVQDRLKALGYVLLYLSVYFYLFKYTL